MMDYETDEQTVEALKKWWSENGTPIIFGLVMGVSLLLGWRVFINYKDARSDAASDLYGSLMYAAVANKATVADIAKGEQLIVEYTGTPYASLASLVLAKIKLNEGDNDSAIRNLDWVINNSGEEELQNIARLRKSRILLEGKEYEQAQLLLDVTYPEGFAAAYEELKGDIYFAQGNIDKARESYNKAVDAPGANASPLLLMKRNNIGA